MNRKSSYCESENVQAAKRMLSDGIPIVVFDLETTGLSKKTDRILSFSAIKIINNDGQIEEDDRIDLFINPGFHIPSAITKINHISDETVKKCPMEAEAASIICDFLGEKPVLCGYNSINFDEGFLQSMYERAFEEKLTPCLHLDVYRMAKEKLDLSSYKLSSVSGYLGADAGLEFHNSIDDVIATTRLLTTLIDMYEDRIEEQKTTLKVNSIAYWNGPSSKLKRIYVNTEPYSKTYYDMYRKEWKSDMDIDMIALRRFVLNYYHVENESELIGKLKKSKRQE